MPFSPLSGRTVVDDPPGLFKKHREEELAERRKLYRSAPPLPPGPTRELLDPFPVPMPGFFSTAGGVTGRTG